MCNILLTNEFGHRLRLGLQGLAECHSLACITSRLITGTSTGRVISLYDVISLQYTGLHTDVEIARLSLSVSQRKYTHPCTNCIISILPQHDKYIKQSVFIIYTCALWIINRISNRNKKISSQKFKSTINGGEYKLYRFM